MQHSQKTEKYRPGVGIIILNKEGQVWLGKMTNWNSWQFPQGGIDEDEKPLAAMYRELYEETGLKPEQVKVLRESRKWYSYKFPTHSGETHNNDVINSFVGQKHKWFLLLLTDDNAEFNLQIHKEFEQYRWVNYWYPLRNIVYFKEDVYRKVLKEFMKYALNRSKTSHFVNHNHKFD